jgi:hypothetical protein
MDEENSSKKLVPTSVNDPPESIARRQSHPYPVEHQSWHDKLEGILLNGTDRDRVGIQANLDWAVDHVEAHPRKAGSRRKVS